MNQRHKGVAGLSLAVCSLLMTTGCGQAPSNDEMSSPAPARVEETTLSPTPSPTAAPVEQPVQTPAAAPEPAGPSADFVATVQDVDGYEFDVAVQLRTTDLGPTVEFDKPGFMSSYFTLGLDMQLINRTPGREVSFESVSGVTKPFGNPKFLISAVWDPGNPVCVARGLVDQTCAIILGFGYADTPIPPDGSVQLETRKGEPSGFMTAGLAEFPEQDWPAVEAALMSPSAFMVSYEGGDWDRFDCPGHGKLGRLVVSEPAGYACTETETEIELVKQPGTL